VHLLAGVSFSYFLVSSAGFFIHIKLKLQTRYAFMELELASREDSILQLKEKILREIIAKQKLLIEEIGVFIRKSPGEKSAFRNSYYNDLVDHLYDLKELEQYISWNGAFQEQFQQSGEYILSEEDIHAWLQEGVPFVARFSIYMGRLRARGILPVVNALLLKRIV
jgi:hypothetical protein